MSAICRKPFYQDVDGFRITGMFLADAFRSAVQYNPNPGDFFIVTFPKCGTTWTQQIVTLIFNRGVSCKDMMDLEQKSPFLELCGADIIDSTRRPDSIKLHLPYHLTPNSSEAKYLYVVRNPKDTLVSFYHHTASHYYKYQDGEFNDYFEIFINGENDFGDYFDHVLGWYEHRKDPNVMFLTYEELKRDTPKAIMKIATFIGEKYAKMLEDEPDIFNMVLKYSSLEHMKYLNGPVDFFGTSELSEAELEAMPSGLKHVMKYIMENKPPEGDVFNIVRKGIVGGWRDVFSEDQNNRMNQKIEDKLKGTDLYDYWKQIDCI